MNASGVLDFIESPPDFFCAWRRAELEVRGEETGDTDDDVSGTHAHNTRIDGGYPWARPRRPTGPCGPECRSPGIGLHRPMMTGVTVYPPRPVKMTPSRRGTTTGPLTWRSTKTFLLLTVRPAVLRLRTPQPKKQRPTLKAWRMNDTIALATGTEQGKACRFASPKRPQKSWLVPGHRVPLGA